MRAKVTSLILLAATLTLFAYQQGVIDTPSSAPAAELPGKPALGSAGTLDLGVTTGPLARDWFKPWQPSDLSTVKAFEREAGKHTAIIMWYAD